MIDSSIDSDFAAFERQESLQETRPAVTGHEGVNGVIERVYRGRLATLSSKGSSQAVEAAVVVPPPDEPALSTPLGHLRAARLGFAAVVVLICYWLWIRKNRT